MLLQLGLAAENEGKRRHGAKEVCRSLVAEAALQTADHASHESSGRQSQGCKHQHLLALVLVLPAAAITAGLFQDTFHRRSVM